MAELKAQDKDLIYALDIGTRSVVGVVGRPVGDRHNDAQCQRTSKY